MWISRLVLTDFRNHAHLALALDARPVVLAGPNGAGKTNVLEAVSLLTAGQGLRRVPYPELARQGGAGGWAIAATVRSGREAIDIGTGLDASPASDRTGRIVKLGGETQSGSGALAEHVELLWLTPAMDGLFTGAASERRRFLDRLVLCFDPAHGKRAGQFERAMRQRNRLLDDGVREPARFSGLEAVMAETGVAMAVARAQAVTALHAVIEARRVRAPHSPFPWATVELVGALESDVLERPSIDVEDAYSVALAQARERDRAAGRTLEGPHRSDLVVGHGPKGMPADTCSTGEQKSLLIGLVLAHAEMMAGRRDGAAPILLLDEVAAHLDEKRRAALFAELIRIGSQAWLTGTDRDAFSPLVNDAQFLLVEDGQVGPPA
jgi:DNA replication and repair protein RecF